MRSAYWGFLGMGIKSNLPEFQKVLTSKIHRESDGRNLEAGGINQMANSLPNTRMVVRNATRDTQIADHLEVAGSGPQRTKGLLGRKGLSQGEGLWIVPCEAVHTFFMKFPIDLIYLDRKQRVKKIRRSVPAWRISGCLTAHSVLELPAGTVLGTKTEPGDLVEFLPSRESAGAPL